jgi:MEMO1 family protein
MRKLIAFSVFVLSVIFLSCTGKHGSSEAYLKLRPLVDTVGFAHYPWQMEKFMERLDGSNWKKLECKDSWKLAISPHDDYTYTGAIYPELLQNVRVPNIILIGVAHKAAWMGIEDSLVFDSYDAWKGPWSAIEVSPAREEIFNILKNKYAVISDSLQKVEHSLEALIPFLQYFRKDIRIIPILVPAMSPERMKECGKALAEAISLTASKHNWTWGKDYAIVATTDAVHYGSEDWGGTDRARFGCDNEGNYKALELEYEIIDNCLKGELTTPRIEAFSRYTLDSANFRTYKWTWCGRYSVPVALYTAFYLNGETALKGELVDYSTSITRFHVPVDDIGMGRTAIATPCHWVGYAAVGYR